jgi:hypothetical protein|tara:strand:- start:251 stop:388 length:138 start_codon:yes stop_codon:yes gene_type:complete
MAKNVTVRHLFISAVVVFYHQHHRRDGWYLREKENVRRKAGKGGG